MAAAPIVFDGVWKKFRRGERHDSLRDLIPALFRGAFGPSRAVELTEQEFWALEDISFEVRAGQALGILGPNGAGKSTILKLLTRILKPTRGHCELRGRVGALIEVAAGFHPDLTGRENIFLQGAIMGMKPDEIRRRLDEIVAFAGVSAAIDTPVKRYSSGMNARLGFSIAAHLSPEVLIIDEILSVGDMAFQNRCVERMIEFKRSGVAIVFVSHNLQAIDQLCDNALYLKRTAVASGPTSKTIERYVTDNAGTLSLGPAAVTILNARLVGAPSGDGGVEPGQRLSLRVSCAAEQDVSGLTFGFLVRRSTDWLLVFETSVPGGNLGLDEVRAGQTFELDFAFSVHLARGHYCVGCHVYHAATGSYVARLETAAFITVSESATQAGIAYLDLEASVRTPGGAAAPLSQTHGV